MKKSLLIINGATRANGNTDILVERVVAGARDTNLNPLLEYCGDKGALLSSLRVLNRVKGVTKIAEEAVFQI